MVHFSPLRPHSDSAAQHRTARFHSSPWSPWSYGSAHHCRLKKQAERRARWWTYPNTYSKRILHTPLPSQTVPGADSKPNSSSQKALEPGSGDRALNSRAILGRLSKGNCPFAWGISAQGGDPHPKPSRSLKVTVLSKKISQCRRQLSCMKWHLAETCLWPSGCLNSGNWSPYEKQNQTKNTKKPTSQTSNFINNIP